MNNLQRRYRETDSMAVKEKNSPNSSNEKECPSCQGARLRVEARFVKVGTGKQEKRFSKSSEIPLHAGMGSLKLKLTGAKRDIADRIIKISSRLTFLNNVGLDYLSLIVAPIPCLVVRAQRIRFSLSIGSGLTGVMYVLDEPSIGLHQRGQ